MLPLELRGDARRAGPARANPRARRPRRAPRPLSAPAVRRRAAARRAGARLRDAAGAAVRRRADRQSRHAHRRSAIIDLLFELNARARHDAGAGDARRAARGTLRHADLRLDSGPAGVRMKSARCWHGGNCAATSPPAKCASCFAALVLAVVAVTAVGFVTDRAGRALAQEANRLLGGDAVVRADSPITGAVRDAANATGPAARRNRRDAQHGARAASACSSANCVRWMRVPVARHVPPRRSHRRRRARRARRPGARHGVDDGRRRADARCEGRRRAVASAMRTSASPR